MIFEVKSREIIFADIENWVKYRCGPFPRR